MFTGRMMMAIASIIATAVVVSGQTTPWVLGDENLFQCYTLSTQADIPTPRGLILEWSTPPGGSLSSQAETMVIWNVTILPIFWDDPSNMALLGTSYSRWRTACNDSIPNPLCTPSTPAECCVWHSNVHSCRSEDSSCEPWITPRNDTTSGSGQVLVTHTATQIGNAHEYEAPLLLPAGSWFIVGHIKIMNFQCAVGAARRVVDPAPVQSGLGAGAIAGIAIACFAIVVLIVLVVIFSLRSNDDAVRDTRFAPREGEITVIFTDIQDSTKLWGEATESMGQALDIHHEIIRKHIVKHECYEVKTAGDAFMIVSKSATAGLALCLEVQKAFQDQAFPICIQQLYSGLEEIDDDPTESMAFPHEPFSGLRVRMGIHTGKPSAIFDEVAKGYDYYGPDINLAARVESQALGGQILCSPAHRAAIIAALDSDPKAISGKPVSLHFTSVGECQLKGMAQDVELHSISASDFIPDGRQAALTKARAEKQAKAAAEGVPLGGAEESQSSFSDQMGYDDRASNVSVAVDPDGLDLKIFGRQHPLVRDGLVTVEQLRAMALGRKKVFDALTKPLKGSKASKRNLILETLCDGWRIKYRADQKDRALNEVISRLLLVDKTARVDNTAALNQSTNLNASAEAPILNLSMMMVPPSPQSKNKLSTSITSPKMLSTGSVPDAESTSDRPGKYEKESGEEEEEVEVDNDNSTTMPGQPTTTETEGRDDEGQISAPTEEGV